MTSTYHRNLREMCSNLAARLDALATGDSECASVARSYVDTVWIEFEQRLEALVLAVEKRFPEARKQAAVVPTTHVTDGARRADFSAREMPIKPKPTPRELDTSTDSKQRNLFE